MIEYFALQTYPPFSISEETASFTAHVNFVVILTRKRKHEPRNCLLRHSCTHHVSQYIANSAASCRLNSSAPWHRGFKYAFFFAVRSPRFLVSGSCTKGRIRGSFDSSYSTLRKQTDFPAVVSRGRKMPSVKFIPTFTEFTRPWWRTLTNGIDVKFVLARCTAPCGSSVSWAEVTHQVIELRLLVKIRGVFLDQQRNFGASACYHLHGNVLRNVPHARSVDLKTKTKLNEMRFGNGHLSGRYKTPCPLARCKWVPVRSQQVSLATCLPGYGKVEPESKNVHI